jgi:hypothetical protein
MITHAGGVDAPITGIPTAAAAQQQDGVKVRETTVASTLFPLRPTSEAGSRLPYGIGRP